MLNVLAPSPNLVLEFRDFDHESDEGGDGDSAENLVRTESVKLTELLHPEKIWSLLGQKIWQNLLVFNQE